MLVGNFVLKDSAHNADHHFRSNSEEVGNNMDYQDENRKPGGKS